MDNGRNDEVIRISRDRLKWLYERTVDSYDIRDMGWCIDRHGRDDACVEPIEELGAVASMLGEEPPKDLAFALLAISLVRSGESGKSENALADAAERMGLLHAS